MTESTPARPGFLAQLFSNQDARADSLVLGGFILLVIGALLEIWTVVVQGQHLDMMSFGAMSGQLLLAMGGGVGAREYLLNRNQQNPPSQGQ